MTTVAPTCGGAADEGGDRSCPYRRPSAIGALLLNHAWQPVDQHPHRCGKISRLERIGADARDAVLAFADESPRIPVSRLEHVGDAPLGHFADGYANLEYFLGARR